MRLDRKTLELENDSWKAGSQVMVRMAEKMRKAAMLISEFVQQPGPYHPKAVATHIARHMSTVLVTPINTPSSQ